MVALWAAAHSMPKSLYTTRHTPRQRYKRPQFRAGPASPLRNGAGTVGAAADAGHFALALIEGVRHDRSSARALRELGENNFQLAERHERRCLASLRVLQARGVPLPYDLTLLLPAAPEPRPAEQDVTIRDAAADNVDEARVPAPPAAVARLLPPVPVAAEERAAVPVVDVAADPPVAPAPQRETAANDNIIAACARPPVAMDGGLRRSKRARMAKARGGAAPAA